jgi:CheY-like chemotaxis protein
MSKKVLVADDEATARGLAVKCLQSAGFSTVTAADGAQAVDVAEAQRPDLILLDLLLPRRDGYAVLLELRSRPSTRGTPVLIVSAEDDPAQMELARTLGAQGFLSKPLKSDVLLGRVEEALREGSGE